ncbi:hypothetical protein ACFXG9_13680 [Streptomyces mirabilis]|uniref:hypothetical protein n=1 Tax=Streptomyces mirabilis TaxID=68239 RepID=UPI0036B9DAED
MTTMGRRSTELQLADSGDKFSRREVNCGPVAGYSQRLYNGSTLSSGTYQAAMMKVEQEGSMHTPLDRIREKVRLGHGTRAPTGQPGPGQSQQRFERKPRKAPWVFAGILTLAIIAASILVINQNQAPQSRPKGSVTATPNTQVPSPSAGQVFADPLTSEHHDPNWPVGDSSCQIETDGLHMTGDAGTCKGPDISLPGKTDVSVKATWISGDPPEKLGINLSTEAIDGYIFSVLRSGEWQTYGPNAADQSEPKFSSAINRGIGESNTLTVEARGSRLTFLVNGQRITSVDTGLSDFSVGLFAYNGGYGGDNEVSFTDLSVNT